MKVSFDLTTDLSTLTSNVLAVIDNEEERAEFVADSVQQIRDLHRKDLQKYESVLVVMLVILEKFDVMQGTSQDIQCELVVLDILLQLDLSTTQILQCNSYLRLCMLNVKDVPIAVAAAKTFGKSLGFNVVSSFTLSEIDAARARMAQIDAKPQCICGMMVVTEVGRRFPMVIWPHICDIFDNLWICLAAKDEEIRDAALRLFSLCVKLLASRSQVIRADMCLVLMHQLKSNLASKVWGKNVAGLLAFEPLVLNTPPLPYEEISIMLVPYIMGGDSNTRVDLVRNLLHRCLVVLCRANTNLFITNQLKDTVSFALESVAHRATRSSAFLMLTDIMAAVGSAAFAPYVEESCEAAIDVFCESPIPCWEALRCFSMICRECKPSKLEVYVDNCISHVYKWGLSLHLIECVRNITASCNLQYQIKLESSLLDLISVTLCGLPFRQQRGTLCFGDLVKESDPSDEQITVALSALRQFGFSSSELMGNFLRDSVLHFVERDSLSVRTAAIHTIVSLLIPPGDKSSHSMARMSCIDTVLARLLVIGLSDRSSAVRRTILSSFTADFYPYLSEPKFLFQLYSALGDENIDCRIAALELLCLMIDNDPSHILLALREEMATILHRIRLPFSNSDMDNGLRSLATIAANAPRFVVNYAGGIYEALCVHFRTMSMPSFLLLSLLRCAAATARAIQLFGKSGAPFQDQVPKVLELLGSLPMERGFQARRLCCLQFLSSALRPSIEGESPYKVYPQLFRQLSSILRNRDESIETRIEAIRCVGVVGALDSHIFQSIGVDEFEKPTVTEATAFDPGTQRMCCRTVLLAISALLDPQDNRCIPNRDHLLRTCIHTFLIITQKCPYSKGDMAVVIGPLSRCIAELTVGSLLVTALFKFVHIIRFVGEGVLNEVDAICNVFSTVWQTQPQYRFLAVRMISAVVSCEGGGGPSRLVQLQDRVLPIILGALNSRDTMQGCLTAAVIDYLIHHATSLQGYCEGAVDGLLNLIQSHNTSTDIRTAAVVALRVICSKTWVDERAGAIVRCLHACLLSSFGLVTDPVVITTSPLYTAIIGVFNVLLESLQQDFLKYSAGILQTLTTLRVTNGEFSGLNSQVLYGENRATGSPGQQERSDEVAAILKKCESVVMEGVSQYGELWTSSQALEDNLEAVNEDERVLPISEQRLLFYVKVLPMTKEEWMKWTVHFSTCVLQESPFQVFRCAALPIGINGTPLAEQCPQFTQDILKIAFRTLWTYATSTLRSAIVDFFCQTLQHAMSSATVPDEVVVCILSIVEYMDHAGLTLSIPFDDLSKCAWKRGMLAKALYWREATYRDDPSGTVDSLISLYSEVHMVDSAVGILGMTSDEHRRSLQQTSLVKLARYAEALALTQQEIEQDCFASESSSSGSYLRHYGYKSSYSAWPITESVDGLTREEEGGVDRRLEMRARNILCLSELGHFDRVLSAWDEMYRRHAEKEVDGGNASTLQVVSQYAADAAIRLQDWGLLQQVLGWMRQDTIFFHVAQASMSIHDGKYEAALACVTAGRKMLLEDLSALLHESYTRAYDGLVVAQELTELEEVICAKRMQQQQLTSEHIPSIAKLWDNRIRCMTPTVPVWKQVLGIRGLLIDPQHDVKTRIRFVKLCRQASATQLQKFTLEQMLGDSHPTYTQLVSPTANPCVVMHYVTFLSASNALEPDGEYGTESEIIKKLIDVHSNADNSTILSRAYARLGTMVDLNEAVECYRASTLYDPKRDVSWRMWAETNAELLRQNYTGEACSNAIKGYIQSILLGTFESTLIQDVLKLLTLWTRYCDQALGLQELRKRVLDVPSRVWHLVVPQLIARLDSGSDESCHLVADIVLFTANDFPHQLIYPLNLCTMSDSERRKKWANRIITSMQKRFPIIVLQGRLVIDELIRTSSLIYEQCYDKLEAAANAFFGRNNRDEMMHTLLSMHETLMRHPETLVEAEFIGKYSATLMEAHEWLKCYSVSRNVAAIHSAWHLYHSVYRQIEARIKSSNTVLLQFCSPKLFEARDLAIGIPDAQTGQQKSVSRISSFRDVLLIISSNQRPKRIALTTVEGKTQKFLLKGREDLRLDERVMQLFGLVNVLMLSDSRSCKKFGFQIQWYSVTPLKDTVGLIGWVNGCDTFHELIKYYREQRNVPVELEMRMLNQIITFDNPKAYDYLSIMSKVETMEFLSDHTSGQDLRKVMWATAPSCEAWMDRRHMYTTSLATMSAVGYILGLGDRHPNNIMLQKTSGLVVHIDFGDCFEVAMTRDKFPEKVPFRLTRMLRNALDVSGVDGAFCSSAETAMSVLREGSDSVMALLEAFIQDPLISWRLVHRAGQDPELSNEYQPPEETMRVPTLRSQENNVTSDSMTTPQMDHSVCTIRTPESDEEVDVVHQGVLILKRLSSKLKGYDFVTTDGEACVNHRVQIWRLIEEATDITNVAQSWLGWYPFW